MKRIRTVVPLLAVMLSLTTVAQAQGQPVASGGAPETCRAEAELTGIPWGASKEEAEQILGFPVPPSETGAFSIELFGNEYAVSLTFEDDRLTEAVIFAMAPAESRASFGQNIASLAADLESSFGAPIKNANAPQIATFQGDCSVICLQDSSGEPQPLVSLMLRPRYAAASN